MPLVAHEAAQQQREREQIGLRRKLGGGERGRWRHQGRSEHGEEVRADEPISAVDHRPQLPEQDEDERERKQAREQQVAGDCGEAEQQQGRLHDGQAEQAEPEQQAGSTHRPRCFA